MKIRLFTLCLLLISAIAFAGITDKHKTVIAAKNISASATDYTADPDMEGYWMMEQAAGPSTATDGTSNGNDLASSSGVLQSTDRVQGSYSAELVFDYEGMSLSDTSLSAGFPGKETTGSAGSFSLGCLVLLDSDNSAGIIGKWSDGNDHSYGIHSDGTNFIFTVSEEGYGGLAITSDTTVIEDGTTWQGIVGVFDSSSDEILIYLQGISDATPLTYAADIFLGSNEFRIGKTSEGGSRMDGHVDECFVMSRALTPTEVLEIYEHGLAGER